MILYKIHIDTILILWHLEMPNFICFWWFI
nr:MAG TPA: hypothetical protein [Caudoviricetes sp.]